MTIRDLFGWIFGSKDAAVPARPRHLKNNHGFVSSYSIEQAWRDHFAPVVRELGFKGSGRHFRKIEGGFVQAVNLQGSQYGGKFAVNLGLQPFGIPNVVGDEFDPKKIKEIECAFRDRLTEEDCDTWWDYTSDPAAMDCAAKAAADLIVRRAPPHFQDQMQYISAITPDEVGRALPSYYVSLALLREAQADIEQARAFVALAVKYASRHWVANSAVKHLL